MTGKKPEIALYDHVGTDGIRRHSGTFTAHFTAHEPFAEMSQKSYTGACSEAALNETGILPTSMMPESPSTDGDFFLLYNPGTEKAHTIIRIVGDVGDGLTIRNQTTGQRCKIVNLKSASLLEGACLELDSRMGQTRIVLGGETEMAFAFHDEGYIDLAPCTPFVRSVSVSYTAGSNIITSAGSFEKRMKGQYVYLNGWKKISQINDENTAIISQSMGSSGSVQTPIVTMNEIEVQSDNA